MTEPQRIVIPCETRIETGPIEFEYQRSDGSHAADWPGVFIRGDNAGYYGFMLQQMLDSFTEKHKESNFLLWHQVQGLAQTLGSCVVRPKE